MNSTEITNLTEKELELLFAEKAFNAEYPQEEVKEEDDFNFWDVIEGVDTSFSSAEMDEMFNIDAIKIQKLEKIDTLKEEIKAEKEAARIEKINIEIANNNRIIEKIENKISKLKPTKAGRSFINFFSGRSQFMTFTEINAAKLRNQIKCILTENKDLLSA